MWFIGIIGILRAKDIDLAKELPIKREPNKPGPCVYAIAFRSFLSIFASYKAWLTIGVIFDWWALEASSGTTPP